MISIQEIPIDEIQDFWSLHITYLVNDGIITDKEDIYC